MTRPDARDMRHVVLRRAKFVSNTRRHRAPASHRCACQCNVTTGEGGWGGSPHSLFPKMFNPTGSPDVLNNRRALAFVHFIMHENCCKCIFPLATLCWERMVFLSCNELLGVLSALCLCLQDSLFLQQPLSRSVLN